MTAMAQQKNFGWKEGKRIAAAVLLGFSLCLAAAQAQELPPLDSFRCSGCDSYPEEFRAGDYSRVAEPIIDPASGAPFPNNRIPQARLLAHGAWPEDLYERNSGVLGPRRSPARRVAQGWTPLHEAVLWGISARHPLRSLNPAHLDRVLDAWPDALNSGLRNESTWLTGRTPLHLAASRAGQHPGMVEWLLARGASVHARESLGYTPLLMASSLEAFEALRAAGADLRAQTDSGFTVLHRAALIGDAATVQELLDAGLNPNAETDSGRTPVLYARSREAFNALRAAGADIRAQAANGYTVLHRAAWVGDAAWVRELLEEEDFNPNAEEDRGWTPVLYARSREAFNALRAAGANLAVIEEAFGPDKLFEATQTSEAGRAQLGLLNRAVQQVGSFLDAAWLPRLRTVNSFFFAVPRNYGRSNAGPFPLHYAAQHNEDPAAIAALIGYADLGPEGRYNVTPNGVTYWPDGDIGLGRPVRGLRPLYSAARYNGNPAVVEALLAAGADVNADNYLSALDAAAENETPRAVEIVQALLAVGADANTPNVLYAAAGNPTPRAAEIVQALLAAGASGVDGGEPGYDGRVRRPVYAAAMVQNIATLDALLEAGANANVEGSTSHYSLLADVLSRGRFDCGYGPVADRLRSAGARAVRFTESGEVPFTPGPPVAECDSVSAEIRALIDAGADLGAQDERGETALHRAAAAGRIADIQALVAAGAEVNAVSRGGGLRALHFAIWRQAGPATVTALLEAGADVNARDSRGGTALHWAARIRQVEPAVVEALLAAGAEVHARDNLGQTALDYATRANIANDAVAALLRAAGED